MAIEDPTKKKPASFSDIPRDGAVVVPTTGLMGAPTMPATAAPLPVMTANMAPQPTPAQAAMPAPAAPAAPAMGYPQPTYQPQGIPASTPAVAPLTGAAPPVGNPSQFLGTPGAGRGMTNPAAVAGPAQRDPMMEAVTAPFRAIGRGVAATYSNPANAGMGAPGQVDALGNVTVPPADSQGGLGSPAAPVSPMGVANAAPAAPGGTNPAVIPSTNQAAVRSVDNGAANAAAIARTPTVTAPVTAPVTPAAGVPTVQTDQQLANGLGRPNALGSMADTNAQIASLKANAIPGGTGATMGVIANTGPEAAQKMFDEANLRNVAARTTTTRKGTTVNEGELAAAMAPITARARMGEVAANTASAQSIAALRDTGDTARANIRETGDAARAALGDQRAQDQLALQRQEFGLRSTGAQLDNAAKQRLAAAQGEYSNAKTQAERDAAQEKIMVISGRQTPQDKYAVTTVGGGSAIDPVTQMPVAQPSRAVVINQRDGTTREVATTPATTAATAKPAPVEGSISNVNGKQAKWIGGKWVPL